MGSFARPYPERSMSLAVESPNTLFLIRSRRYLEAIQVKGTSCKSLSSQFRPSFIPTQPHPRHRSKLLTRRPTSLRLSGCQTNLRSASSRKLSASLFFNLYTPAFLSQHHLFFGPYRSSNPYGLIMFRAQQNAFDDAVGMFLSLLALGSSLH